jgi:hypothetical protein
VLIRLGPKRLTGIMAKASNHHQSAEAAAEWLAAAQASLDLYADHPAVAFADLAAEIAPIAG